MPEEMTPIYEPQISKDRVRSILDEATRLPHDREFSDHRYYDDQSEVQRFKNSGYGRKNAFIRDRLLVEQIDLARQEMGEAFEDPLNAVNFVTEAVLLHNAVSTDKLEEIKADYLETLGLTENEHTDILFNRYVESYIQSAGLGEDDPIDMEVLEGFSRRIPSELRADAFIHYIRNEMSGIDKAERVYRKRGLSVGFELEYTDPDRRKNIELEGLLDIDNDFYSVSIHLAALGTHKDIRNYTERYAAANPDGVVNREAVSAPSYSFKTQFLRYMRMIEIQNAADGYMRQANKHMTISNIELSPENTRIMHARIMLEACGLVHREEPTELNELHVEVPKVIDIPNGILYFPFHSRKVYPSLENNKELVSAVEFRSFPRFRTKTEEQKFADAANEIRMADYTVNYSLGEMTLEKVLSGVAMEEDHVVANMYIEHLDGYVALIKEYNLPMPKDLFVLIEDKDMFYSLSKDKQVELLDNSPYNYYLTRVAYLSENNPQFRNSANKLRIDFNKKIKATIGL